MYRLIRKNKLFLFIFFICSRNVYSLDMHITGKEIETSLRGEYNRTFYQYGEISAVGAIELNNRYKVRGGLSFGASAFDNDINTFINAGCSPFLKFPLNFSVSYIYNGLPEYEAHTHSIMPIVSFNAKRAGISIGPNFRLSSFFGEPAIFESILSFYVYFNLINNNTLHIGTAWGNYNDFHAKNIGAYSLDFYAIIRLHANWNIISEVELMQSGGDGLSSAFYGISCRAGVKYSW